MFFSPKEWSSRFGENFFTVIIDQFVKHQDSVYWYKLLVKKGIQETIVMHRYSDFVLLKRQLEDQGVNELGGFPPKGWWWQYDDENFLENRKEALQSWLHKQISSNTNLLVIRRFIEL